jgi:hypothetical protein
VLDRRSVPLQIQPTQLATRLSGGPLRPLREVYFRLFVCKAPPKRFGSTFLKWRLLVGDTLFVGFVLATSLVTYALGSRATAATMRGILSRCVISGNDRVSPLIRC